MFEAVEIEINSHCNKSCSYCPNSKFDRIENGFISDELFQKIIDQLSDLSFKGRISFSFYNEPLLNKKLGSYVENTKKYLPETFIELYTNGSLLTKEKIVELISIGVDQFTITKHEDVQDSKLDETINDLSQSLRAQIKYQNFYDIKLTNRGGVLPHLGSNEKTVFLPCKIPEKIMTITMKGNVLPCFEDFFQKNEMGNVNEQHIQEIWNSARYVEFRNNLARGLRHKYNVCKDCSRLEVL